MKTRALFFALTGLVLTVAAATSCVADRLASVPSIVRAPAPDVTLKRLHVTPM
jgi:hypothetical protein